MLKDQTIVSVASVARLVVDQRDLQIWRVPTQDKAKACLEMGHHPEADACDGKPGVLLRMYER